MSKPNLAAKGLCFLYPVRINGKTHRQTGVEHHMTVKFFDKPDVSAGAAHMAIQDLKHHTPDPKGLRVTPSVFQDRFGNNLYALKLEGDSVRHIVENNAKLAHLGEPVKYKFAPHITVDKDVYDKAVAMGTPKASDLGIEFDKPKLRLGSKTLISYE